MKILCWVIVIIGWVAYGLLLLIQFLYPHKETDPIEDIQHFFSASAWEHWQFNLVAMCIVGIYLSAWVYLQKDKEE